MIAVSPSLLREFRAVLRRAGIDDAHAAVSEPWTSIASEERLGLQV